MEQPVLISYMRVSKADGSQTLDLQQERSQVLALAPPHSETGVHWMAAPITPSDRLTSLHSGARLLNQGRRRAAVVVS